MPPRGRVRVCLFPLLTTPVLQFRETVRNTTLRDETTVEDTVTDVDPPERYGHVGPVSTTLDESSIREPPLLLHHYLTVVTVGLPSKHQVCIKEDQGRGSIHGSRCITSNLIDMFRLTLR